MYSKILLIFLLFIIQCEEKEHMRPATGAMYYFLNTYLPEQKAREERQIQCSQPNAILTEFSGGSGCYTGKVTQGFIYDAFTKEIITTDTLSPGQSFLCKCNSETSNSFFWERGTVQDSPPPGTNTFKIFNSRDAGHTNNDALVYGTHYNKTDNLYCFPANCGFSEWKYQFLKIR